MSAKKYDKIDLTISSECQKHGAALVYHMGGGCPVCADLADRDSAIADTKFMLSQALEHHEVYKRAAEERFTDMDAAIAELVGALKGLRGWVHPITSEKTISAIDSLLAKYDKVKKA